MKSVRSIDIKNPLTGKAIGVVRVPKLENYKQAPEPHEMDTAVRIASEGKDVLHVGTAEAKPDLEIRPFSPDGTQGPPQIWDLKSSKNAASIENAINGSIDKSNEKAGKWFVNNNLPYRLVIDVSKKYSTQEVQNYIDILKAKSDSAKIKEKFNKIEELLIYTTDGLVNHRK